MLGLKINYHKSEMIAFGVDEEEQQVLANILNCRIGQMPMKYLGFPISDRSLGVQVFKDMVEKMRKKLQPWKRQTSILRGQIDLDQFLPQQHANLPDGYVQTAKGGSQENGYY